MTNTHRSSPEWALKQAQPEKKHSDEMEDCSFYDCLYGPEKDVVEESEALVAYKLQEIEREMDQLSNELKESYFIALDQEIKQRTDYVRSRKFLLAFLRAEQFDARKAALRLAKHFKYKLELFGAEMLPRRINQEDLNENDLKLLSSGWMQYCGADCGGRFIMFYQRGVLQQSGFLNEAFFVNMQRVFFYISMFAIESNEMYQKKGGIGIRWNFNCSQSLKDYRMIYKAGFLQLSDEAIPFKIVALHVCYSNATANMCVAWSKSVLPKRIGAKTKFHNGASALHCFGMLSKYGIDIEDLPVTASGEVNHVNCMKRLEQLQHEEISTMMKEIDGVDQGYDCNSLTYSSKLDHDSPIEDVDMEFFSLNKSAIESHLRGLKASVDIAGAKPSKLHAVVGKYSNRKSPVYDRFPVKLMEVLQSNIAPEALWWSRDGTAFAIEKKRFSTSILPKYFGGIKFDSFLRRLQRWKFQRISTKGEASNYAEYQHRFFQRNSPHLLKDWNISEESSQKRDKLPVRLWKVMESNAASDCIWWVYDGKAFAIEMNKFSRNVLKKDFDGLKISSFLRMLRKWGFRRLSEKEQSTGKAFVFQHPLFRQNTPLSHILLENWAESGGESQLPASKGESFPKKLYRIICSKKAKDTIWWGDDGKTFAILPVEFTRDVLTKEYNGIKFRSFTRNLQRWGFKKMPADATMPNVAIFRHPQFCKDHPRLLDNWDIKDKTKATFFDFSVEGSATLKPPQSYSCEIRTPNKSIDEVKACPQSTMDLISQEMFSDSHMSYPQEPFLLSLPNANGGQQNGFSLGHFDYPKQVGQQEDQCSLSATSSDMIESAEKSASFNNYCDIHLNRQLSIPGSSSLKSNQSINMPIVSIVGQQKVTQAHYEGDLGWKSQSVYQNVDSSFNSKGETHLKPGKCKGYNVSLDGTFLENVIETPMFNFGNPGSDIDEDLLF